MAITDVRLLGAGGDTTNQATAYVTSDYDSTAATAQLVVVTLARTDSTNPTAPTVARDGVTYTLVRGRADMNTGTSTQRRGTWLFRGVHAGAVTAGLTVTPNQAGGAAVAGCSWVAAEPVGVDSGGTNAANAVHATNQADVSNTTTATVTLPSAVTAGNATFAVIGQSDATDIVPVTPFVEIGEASHSNPNTATQAQWDAGGAQTSSWTLASGAPNNSCIAVELVAGTVAPASSILRPAALLESTGTTGAVTTIDEDVLDTSDFIDAVDPSDVHLVIESEAVVDSTQVPTFRFWAANTDDVVATMTATASIRQGYVDAANRGTVVAEATFTLTSTPTQYEVVAPAAVTGSTYVTLIVLDSTGGLAPVVDAGPDVAFHTVGTEFSRTAVEDDGGNTITSRQWRTTAGPGAPEVLGTAATLVWTPTVAGTYIVEYTATNVVGTSDPDSFAITVAVLGGQALTDPPRDGLTEQQVLDSLAWQHSTDLRWGVDLLDTATLAVTGITLDFQGGRVSWQWRAQPNPGDAPVVAAVRRQCDLTFRHLSGFNPLSVYYRPHVEMRGPDGAWVRWWLGVFAATMPGFTYDGLADHEGPVVWRSVQLADISHIWQSDETADPVVVAVGTDIPQWVRDDISPRFNVFDTSSIVGSGTASIDYVFDVGTAWLDIYSTLLSAIGNTPLYANANGAPESVPLVDPSVQPADVTYPFGSTVVPSASVEAVNPDLPNTVRFVARRGPSLAEEGNGIRTVINESVGPGSLQQRGGRTVQQTVDVDAQTQTELDAHARAWAPFYFAGGGLRYVGEVGLDPRHDDATIVHLDRPPMGLSGTWLVTAWTIQLGSASEMATMSLELEQLTGTAFAQIAPLTLGATGTFPTGFAMTGGAP